MTKLVDSPQLDVVQRACLDHYDLGRIESAGALTGGMFAQPVLLRTDRGPRILRVHTFRATESAFRFQAETVQWAFDQGVPCAPVQPTREGAWSVPLPGEEGAAAVHHYVEGASSDWPAWHRRKETEPDFLWRLGGYVGQMHNQLATAQPSGDPNLSSTLPPIQFAYLEPTYAHWQESISRINDQEEIACCAARRRLLELDPQIDRHWQRLLTLADRRQIAALPRQIVHGDVSAVNLVWDEGNRAVFIDWDAVHYGHRLYDALGDVLNRVPENRPDWNRFRSDHVEQFLAGYSEVLDDPLSDLELELAPTFCLARQLEDLRQRVAALPRLAQAEDRKYARLIQMRVEMMDQIETG